MDTAIKELKKEQKSQSDGFQSEKDKQSERARVLKIQTDKSLAQVKEDLESKHEKLRDDVREDINTIHIKINANEDKAVDRHLATLSAIGKIGK